MEDDGVGCAFEEFGIVVEGGEELEVRRRWHVEKDA